MKNGTIVLFKLTKEFIDGKKWYEKIVYKAIGFFTGRPYVHCGQIILPDFYESGHPFGFKKSKFVLKKGQRYEYHEPIDNYTKAEITGMQRYWEKNLVENTRYNYRKFLLMIIIHPTRKIWDKIRFVFFQNNYLWGCFCSAALYEAVEAGGRTLLPGRYKETIAPGDFLDSKLLQKVEVINED